MGIEIKTIGELKELNFVVPAYQRGYRWTEDEVTALLDDIRESPAGSKYCIQPLIVKSQAGKYEVVDGQQRLTSIYIFMKIASPVPPFDLNYETREKSAEFLKSLSDGTMSKENIDFHHMSNAYKAMNEWFARQPDKSVAIQEMNKKIRTDVFFIWHEIPEGSNTVEMFTRVNSGKIPLTNAELIKALLLNSENFTADADRRQIEISVAWDRIEQGLQDDSFWYFLNQQEQNGTRIDMLFELLAAERNNNGTSERIPEQKLFPFLVFYAGLKRVSSKEEKEKYVMDVWNAVETLYSEFRDWYADLDKYHIIGYLIATGPTISSIFQETRDKRKSEVMQILRKKAYGEVEAIPKDKLAELTYTDDKQKVRHLLLLFNIATLVCKSEKQYRFPFDIYKKSKWDIEHIHAIADKTAKQNAQNVSEETKAPDVSEEEPDDRIGNLTLLDEGTNRSYKNAPFKEKRTEIMEREKAGLFVPLCTKNVFLKAYSSKLDDMTLWDQNDKVAYIKAIADTLDLFMRNGGSVK